MYDLGLGVFILNMPRKPKIQIKQATYLRKPPNTIKSGYGLSRQIDKTTFSNKLMPNLGLDVVILNGSRELELHHLKQKNLLSRLLNIFHLPMNNYHD